MPQAKRSLDPRSEPSARQFIGREELLRDFADALGSLTSDQHRVLVYCGVGGIGKSRLIRRLRVPGPWPSEVTPEAAALSAPRCPGWVK